jgi:hypothetical protein
MNGPSLARSLSIARAINGQNVSFFLSIAIAMDLVDHTVFTAWSTRSISSCKLTKSFSFSFDSYGPGQQCFKYSMSIGPEKEKEKDQWSTMLYL